MMDCLHFLFEEDFTNVSDDHARSRSAIRTHLYTELYGVDYKFKVKDRAQANQRGGIRAGTADNAFVYPEEIEDMDSVETFDPKKNDSFSPRTPSNTRSTPTPEIPKKSKVAFVDAASVPVVQNFNPAEALG